MDRSQAQKNIATSYGLTIVAWLPLSAGNVRHIFKLQKQVKRILPTSVSWYDASHLHVTLAAPLRGRYRSWPPLQRIELPMNLESFISDLASFFNSLGLLEIALSGLFLSIEGYLFSKVTTSPQIRPPLVEILQKYPEFDRSDSFAPLHMTLGYILPASEQIPLEKEIELPFSVVEHVDKVWLVHYSNRTLSQIIGKVAFSLGEPAAINVPELLDALGIQ